MLKGPSGKARVAALATARSPASCASRGRPVIQSTVARWERVTTSGSNGSSQFCSPRGASAGSVRNWRAARPSRSAAAGVVALEEAEDAEGERVLGPVVGVAGLDPGAEVPGHPPGGGQLPLEQVERVDAGHGGQVLRPGPELAAQLGAAREVLDRLLGREPAGGDGGDAPLEPAADLQQVPDARVGELGDHVEGLAVALEGLGDGPAAPGLVGAGQDGLVGVQGPLGQSQMVADHVPVDLHGPSRPARPGPRAMRRWSSVRCSWSSSP